MKSARIILSAVAAAALGVSSAHADTTTYVYITGATAFRGAAINAIKAYLSGEWRCIFGNKSLVTGEGNASNVAFRGYVSGSPTDTVIIKCAWGGSVGGVKLITAGTSFTVDSQPGVLGWIPDGAIPPTTTANHTSFSGDEDSTNFTIVPYPGSVTAVPFERGSGSALPDAAFTDAYVSSAVPGAQANQFQLLGTNTPDSEGIVGVIPFDAVVSNGVTLSSVTEFTGVSYASGDATIKYTAKAGSATTVGKTIGGVGIPVGTIINADAGPGAGGGLTLKNPTTLAAVTVTAANDPQAVISSADTAEAPISNITSNQLRRLIEGASTLSQYTGLVSDASVGVVTYGRNADSGTRISALGESYRGITQTPAAHVQPTITDIGGGNSNTNGKAGRPGRVVTVLKRWPVDTVLTVAYGQGGSGYNGGGDLADALSTPGAGSATITSLPGGKPGWAIGWLGRGDASRACQRTFGQNTAKRLTFNGEQDWSGSGSANNVDGTPAGGFLNSAIIAGHYQGWEYEHFFARTGTSGTKLTALNAIADAAVGQATGSSAVKFSDMLVSKTVEGGPIKY